MVVHIFHFLFSCHQNELKIISKKKKCECLLPFLYKKKKKRSLTKFQATSVDNDNKLILTIITNQVVRQVTIQKLDWSICLLSMNRLFYERNSLIYHSWKNEQNEVIDNNYTKIKFKLRSYCTSLYSKIN